MRVAAPIARLAVGAIVVSALAGVLAPTGGSASARVLARPAAAPATSSPVSAAVTATSAWTQLPNPYPSPAKASGIATFGDAGVAVIGGGTIAVSTDGGATWTQRAPPAGTAPMRAVTFASTSDGWAVGADGTILLTSDGGATWSAPTTPVPPADDLSAVALLGSPQPQLLVGGKAGLLERMVLSSGTWATDSGALTADIVSCAAGPGGVAYALSSDGHVERTLSYGAAPLTLSVSTSTVTATHDVYVTAASAVRAPGTVVFDEQSAGGAWQPPIGRWTSPWPWTKGSVAPGAVLDDEPLSTTSYRLRFVFAGHLAASATVTIGVRPEISLARTSLRLRRGAVYRLSGQVWPAEPGAEVTIWTDRGGRWHRIASGGVVRLVGGSSFATRRFGTPVRQSYELQVRLAANAAHLAAKSALVKVTVR